MYHITNRVSNYFGKFANTKFPPFLQKLINKAYVSLLGVDMSEFAPAHTYKSLNEFFTRELIKKREFNTDADHFIAPTDSLITDFGTIKNGFAYQIRGMKYYLSNLLRGVDELKIKNVVFRGPLILGQGESVHFKDPDGNHLEIRCPAKLNNEKKR